MSSNLPSVHSYGRGSNAVYVELGPLTVWFSYKTPIAFSLNGQLVVRRNDWSTTTGGHLTAIDGGNKDSRVDGETFGRLWAERVAPLFDFSKV